MVKTKFQNIRVLSTIFKYREQLVISWAWANKTCDRTKELKCSKTARNILYKN